MIPGTVEHSVRNYCSLALLILREGDTSGVAPSHTVYIYEKKYSKIYYALKERKFQENLYF